MPGRKEIAREKDLKMLRKIVLFLALEFFSFHFEIYLFLFFFFVPTLGKLFFMIFFWNQVLF